MGRSTASERAAQNAEQVALQRQTQQELRDLVTELRNARTDRERARTNTTATPGQSSDRSLLFGRGISASGQALATGFGVQGTVGAFTAGGISAAAAGLLGSGIKTLGGAYAAGSRPGETQFEKGFQAMESLNKIFTLGMGNDFLQDEFNRSGVTDARTAEQRALSRELSYERQLQEAGVERDGGLLESSTRASLRLENDMNRRRDRILEQIDKIQSEPDSDMYKAVKKYNGLGTLEEEANRAAEALRKLSDDLGRASRPLKPR